MVKKRGQAAMEFLMTYGWALLVVLVAIGALAFFGVLNPGQFLPSTCTITPGISCNAFQATAIVTANDGTVTLVLQNGMGVDLESFEVTMPSICGATIFTDAGGDDILSDGEEDSFSSGAACDTGTEGSRLKEDISISYDVSGGLSHTKTGQLVVKVE